MTWRAGAAEVVITPPVGVEFEGYGNRAGGSTGVHDNLYAHALVLDDGSRRAVIVTADVIGLDAPIVAKIRLACRELDVPPERVLVAATHTHCGPRGLVEWRGNPDVAMVEIITRQIVGAIRTAAGRMAPARLMAGEGRIDSVGMNRRFPDGPMDTTVRVLRVEGEDGELRAALVNYGLHPTILNFDTLEIGRDWPGYVDSTIKALWGSDAVVLFANGACADVNPVKISETFAETRRVGTIVGAEAARVLGELAAQGKRQEIHNLLWSERPLKAPSNGVEVAPRLAGTIEPVTFAWKTFRTPEQYTRELDELRAELATIPEGEAGQTMRRTIRPRFNAVNAESQSAVSARRMAAEQPGGLASEVQALALGDGLVLVTAPGELMWSIGAAIEDASQVERTWLIGYANDSVGYLITDAAHDEGGYEGGRALFVKGVESQLREAAGRAISRVKEEVPALAR